MGNGPDELARVLNILPDQKGAQGLEHDFLGQVLGILYAFAPFQGKAKDGVQVLCYGVLRSLFVHWLAPR